MRRRYVRRMMREQQRKMEQARRVSSRPARHRVLNEMGIKTHKKAA
jgi:hypothetical protein